MSTEHSTATAETTSAPTTALAMDAVIVEDAELNEIYAGPRQDVTH